MSAPPAAGGPPITVANAPVSYGAFEITMGHDPNVPDGVSVLDQVAEAGYAGIDLGPAGYLGTGERLGNCSPNGASAWPARTWNCPTPMPTPWTRRCPAWMSC